MIGRMSCTLRERVPMDGYGKRILVVDEDPGCQALLEVQLEQEGYAVYTACDGVAGTDEMRKRHFDAVITDGHMPGFSGVEFAKFYRTSWSDTLAILLTRDPNCTTDNEGEVDKASIRKPCEAAQVLSILRTATQPVQIEQAPSPWLR